MTLFFVGVLVASILAWQSACRDIIAGCPDASQSLTMNVDATAFHHRDDKLRSADVTTEVSGFIAMPRLLSNAHGSVWYCFLESLKSDTLVRRGGEGTLMMMAADRTGQLYHHHHHKPWAYHPLESSASLCRVSWLL